MKENILDLTGNKYFNWYWNICNRAKDRILEKNIYIEKHHIYPVSIFGKNVEVISLTAKEHYIVHLLLWWALRTKYGAIDDNTRKMANAFHRMSTISKDNNKRIKINSDEYSFLKIAQSEKRKGLTPTIETRKKMSESGKKRKPMSEETRKKLSESLKGKKPWNSGTKGLYSKEHREKISNGVKSAFTDEHREQCRELGKISGKLSAGKKQSEETVKKRAEKNTGKKRTIEQKNNISKAHIGKKMSEESIQKTKETKLKNKELYGYECPLKGRVLSDNTKDKISQSKKGKSWTQARRDAQLKKGINND